ncbi:MAG: metal ABC transporter permease [Thaumarchaeota archaeon]|jgi:ABC-type Mn2+/Zn2+ transport system permease subunit|nr:metal ABC transporter permease [Candidatus Terraquivivens yellowstonensis]MCL7393064.1 metal ABC transporter permease [Candidatus Terraquivivens yellowstonensis]MCL7395339.1 metal ABC transporter permease [Candidatus Terraquivivens yellowstonensis]MCL7398737.1 metal ABC transporter permease [Candidatus Terraquivivens yellowstonensis]
MVDLLSPFLIKAYVAVLLMAATSIIGSVAVLRGVAYMPAEAAHAALGGAALGILLGYVANLTVDPYLVAAIFASITTLFAGYVGRKGGPEAIASALAGALTLGVSVYAFVRYILPAQLRVILDGYLVGDILLLGDSDIVTLSILTMVCMVIFAIFYNEIIYVCFDPEGAEAMGMNASFYDFIIFFLIGLAGSVATKTVGTLIVYALVIAPAITAKELSRSVNGMLTLTVIITLVAGYGGLALSIIFNMPSSGSIAIFASAIYVGTMLAKKLFQKQ